MPDSMEWVKANVRCCDICGRETDAGEWPNWPEGICEDCDPDILLSYFDCDKCEDTFPTDFMKVISGNDLVQSSTFCYSCYFEENENA